VAIITDITVSADQFALGRLLGEFPGVEIELERMVPLQQGIIPLFWIDNASPDAVESAIRDDPLTEAVERLSHVGEKTLFQVQWSPDVNSLVQPMVRSGADVLHGEGAVDEWQFSLQFEDRNALRVFRSLCSENGVDYQLDALYDLRIPIEGGEDALTDEQYDIIATAYENGFWDIPRGITMGELAELTGISNNAASQRMRRGLKRLVGTTLDPAAEL
jgi:hypothetical protein